MSDLQFTHLPTWLYISPQGNAVFQLDLECMSTKIEGSHMLHFRSLLLSID